MLETPDHPEIPRHPIPDDTVEQAYNMAAPDYTLASIHSHLEKLQEALEYRLTHRKLFDPLDHIGTVPHRFLHVNTNRYKVAFFIEDGNHDAANPQKVKMALAAREVRNDPDSPHRKYEEGTPDRHDAFSEEARSRASVMDLDDYTEEERREAVGLTFGLWPEVPDYLDMDPDGAAFDAIQYAHSLYYAEYGPSLSDYATNGFVVGVPRAFYAGMRFEQRLFSWLVKQNLSPTEVVDVYGTRASYPEHSRWASKRGVSTSAVSQSRKKGRATLKENNKTVALPKDLFTDAYD